MRRWQAGADGVREEKTETRVDLDPVTGVTHARDA
jgi:hypothetical protein